MAFNKAPSQSTYQTRDVKLIMTPDNRDAAGTKDVIALNGFYDLIRNRDTGDNDYHFVKRDGMEKYPHIPSGTEIRGLHFWQDEDKVLVAYDTKIDIITASTGVLVTTVTPFTTTTGDVGFTEFQYASGDVKVVACDGVRLITIDSSNVVVTGSDPDMPTPMKPYPVYLDGFLFIIKDGTADIYNSNLDDPLAYTSGDFITAEMLPDTLLRIARLRNYMVAMGTGSIEYFYNAANPSGSPLNRNDTPVKQIGLLGGLVDNSGEIYFIGQNEKTGPQLMVLEDFKLKELESFPLRRYLQPDDEYEAAIISMGGHEFYVLNAGTYTYMMDLQTEIWTRIAFKGTNAFPIKYAVHYFRNGIGNTSLVAFDNTTTLYSFDPDLYQDDGTNFTASLQTEKQMFDTIHEKYMSRLMVVADRPTVNANVEISWSDDDYQTYSAPRTVNINQEFPAIQRLGRFRRRAFKTTFTENAPMRIKYFEVDFNIGSR